jgi:uncharacterized protein YsxB (DUF464 family)
VDHRGALRGFSLSGHAETGRKGEDIVCAAVSVLFRTAARALQLQPEIGARGGADQAGSLELEIVEVPAQRQQWLIGLTDFLIRGATDLEEENPAAISVRVIEGED